MSKSAFLILLALVGCGGINLGGQGESSQTKGSPAPVASGSASASASASGSGSPAASASTDTAPGVGSSSAAWDWQWKGCGKQAPSVCTFDVLNKSDAKASYICRYSFAEHGLGDEKLGEAPAILAGEDPTTTKRFTCAAAASEGDGTQELCSFGWALDKNTAACRESFASCGSDRPSGFQTKEACDAAGSDVSGLEDQPSWRVDPATGACVHVPACKAADCAVTKAQCEATLPASVCCPPGGAFDERLGLCSSGLGIACKADGTGGCPVAPSADACAHGGSPVAVLPVCSETLAFGIDGDSKSQAWIKGGACASPAPSSDLAAARAAFAKRCADLKGESLTACTGDLFCTCRNVDAASYVWFRPISGAAPVCASPVDPSTLCENHPEITVGLSCTAEEAKQPGCVLQQGGDCSPVRCMHPVDYSKGLPP